MKLHLYYTASADNEINKILTDELVIDIFLTSQVDIINPILTLESMENSNFRDFNYCYIPELNRYYFIDGITNINAKIFSLNCSCDVLTTYKKYILQLDARVNRNIKSGDFISIDAIINSKADITKYNSDVTLDDEKTFIMATLGEN